MSKIYTSNASDWNEAIEKLKGTEPIEIAKEFFDYFLGVLPPVGWGRKVTLANGRKVQTAFEFAEGAEYIRAFWTCDKRYFACRTNKINNA